MTTLTEFHGDIEAEVDARRRISLGKVGRHEHRRYRVQENALGEILLTPVVSVPAREMLLWQHPGLRESLERGIEQAELGKLVDLGSFARFAEDDVD